MGKADKALKQALIYVGDFLHHKEEDPYYSASLVERVDKKNKI